MTNTLLDRRRFLIGLGATTALTLAGCNASAGGGSDASSPSAGGGGFSWTDARGKTIELASLPTAVVAQSSAAAALWDFGFRVAGAYGELGTDANGKLDYQAGNLDLTKLTVIGKTYGEFDVEKYAALSPDLLIDLSFDDKTLWYVPEKSLAQVEKIGPTLGMKMLSLDLLQITQNFSELAGALGADQNATAVTEAKTAFEASAQKVKDAVAANPGLTVLGISRTADKAWIANAGQHPDFAYLEKLGVKFVPAGGKATDYFTEISYEELDKYSADLIFDDARSPATQQASDKVGVWQALPAVKAGQVHDWKAAAPYSYLAGAPIFADFAAALTSAKKVTS